MEVVKTQYVSEIHPRARAEALDYILAKIFSGELKQGQAIPSETELTERCSVSRTAVREAIRFLSAKGIISGSSSMSTTVKPLSAWSLLDKEVLQWLRQSHYLTDILEHVLEVRLIIEPEAAALASVRASTSEIHDIEAALKRMESGGKENQKDAVEGDVQFHAAILKASDNLFLNGFKELFSLAIETTIRLTFEGVKDTSPSIKCHRELYEAIRSRDPIWARKVASKILDYSVQDMRDLKFPVRPDSLLILKS